MNTYDYASQPDLFASNGTHGIALVNFRDAVPTEARELRDEGISRAEGSEDEFWRSTADQAIFYLAELGRDFSMNEVRALGVAEPIRPRAWAARFTAAAKAGVITPVGATRSTKVTSRGALITVWCGTAAAAARAEVA